MDNMTDAERQQYHASASVKPNQPWYMRKIADLTEQRDDAWRQVEELNAEIHTAHLVQLRLVRHIDEIGGQVALDKLKAEMLAVLNAPPPMPEQLPAGIGQDDPHEQAMADIIAGVKK